jgi:hypothetical protein
MRRGLRVGYMRRRCGCNSKSGIIIVLFWKITKNVWAIFDAMMGVFVRIALPNVMKFKNEPIIQ